LVKEGLGVVIQKINEAPKGVDHRGAAKDGRPHVRLVQYPTLTHTHPEREREREREVREREMRERAREVGNV
jgi:hypothetical protein